MYIYLDKQGVVKEIINDEALRQSASNVNEIYVYCDGLQESDIGSVLATYGLPDGTITDEMQVATQTEEREIPYDAERDLKYFQYYKAYAFYHFAIADLALSQEGVVRLMLRLAQKDGEYIKVAGLICFDVEAELVKDDHGVSLAQYNYLVKAWMDTKECLPLDGSKAMRANLDMGTHSVVLNGKALKDNNGALNYNSKDLAKQEDVSPLQGDVASLKQDNTKNKADIDSLKADNTANKADISALKTDNTKSKENIVGLQSQIDTINATQNVVDIVGTKAELNAYSTKDLHAKDKIEVLVDESQNNANTIYEWNGKAWSLVGSKAPYYSQAESDARYNELKAKSYDKDATGYVTGHVPDSGMVKGSLDSISESVETLSIEAIKKNTDANLKSVTIPTANDLKTKDGSSFTDKYITEENDTLKIKSTNADVNGFEVQDASGIGLFSISPILRQYSELFNVIYRTFDDDGNDYVLFVKVKENEHHDTWLNISTGLPNGGFDVSLPPNAYGTIALTSDLAPLQAKTYDKDATLDDLTQGHVPDSNVVKGISVDVKAQKQMLDTLGDETIKNTQNIENLSKVMPTDIGLNSNKELYLIHDNQEITGQDNKVLIGFYTDGRAIKSVNKINGNYNFGYFTFDCTFSDNHVESTFFRLLDYGGSTFEIKNIGTFGYINFWLTESNTMSLIFKKGFDAKIYLPTKSGTLALTSDIPDVTEKQDKLYHHTVTLHNATTPAYFAFSIDSTWQAEITKDTLFNVLNAYIVVGTGVVHNAFIDKISFRNTAEKTKVHQYANLGVGGYINSEATFTSVFGTDYTLEDVTYPLA